MNPLQYKRKLFILAGGLVVIVMVALLFFGMKNSGKGVVIEIYALPRDAKIKIDGKDSDTKTRLEPGKEYTFSATREGFADSENILVVDQAMTVTLVLDAISEEAKEYVSKNQNLYLEAERISGLQAQERGREFRNKNPIIDNLPYNGGYYRIDYGQNDNNLELYITADGAIGRQVALEKIRSWGFQPHDYHIEFPNFINPFMTGASE